jgi:exosortase
MIFLALLIVVAACWPTSLALHERWTDWEDTTYTHGWLIAAVTLFLLWRNREAIRETFPRLSPLALALLFIAGLFWALCVRAGLGFLEWLMFPLLLWLGVWAAAGIAAARRNLFAIGFLYFAMPLWGAVNGLFLWMTVIVVRALLRVSDVPAYFDGNLVQVPAGVFEIAGGCSGLHFMVVALALAALMGELRNDNLRGRLALLAIAGALALVTNWVRVFTVILAGHYSDMQHYLVKVSHYGYGWCLFALAMLVFFLVERRIELAGPPGGGRAGQSDEQGENGSSAFRPIAAMALVMIAIAALQVLSARPAPATVQGTGGGEGWQALVEGADIRTSNVIETPSGRIDQQQYIFLSQMQAKELGGYSEDPTGGETVLASRPAIVGGVPITLYETSDLRGGLWLVAASYSVGSHRYATADPAKVRYAWESLLRLRSQAGALTVWRAPCNPDCRTAEHVLGAMMAVTEEGGTVP